MPPGQYQGVFLVKAEGMGCKLDVGDIPPNKEIWDWGLGKSKLAL
jgi:hypothetical protein